MTDNNSILGPNPGFLSGGQLPESRYAPPTFVPPPEAIGTRPRTPAEKELARRLDAEKAVLAKAEHAYGGPEVITSTFREMLELIAARVHANNIAKGWWDDRMREVDPAEVASGPRVVSDRAQIPGLLMLVVSELSEALEAHRKHNPQDKHLPDLPAFDVELADAVIRILDIARAYRVDLGRAIVEKMAFNATRPHRHGGKAC